MISILWMEKRRSHWERLESLVGRAANGLAALDHSELREIGMLYRQTASDLSVALQDPSSKQLAGYLNQLLGRSHNLLYSSQRASAGGILNFYLHTYPRIFRETLSLTALGAAIFVVAAIGSWAITLRDPGFAHRLLGPRMMDTIERREMWTHSVVTMKPVAASSITTNNLTVSFTTFALGVTVIGPIWMMLLNGMLIGVVGAATWQAGMAGALWSFVAPHGSLELPAIFIAAGAGLCIGRGLLFPGYLSRRASLVRAGGQASKLVLGTVPLLVVAGVIEGFFSATEAPAGMKFALGGLLFAVLLAYLFGASRGTTTAPDL